jgi:hypothetical protein
MTFPSYQQQYPWSKKEIAGRHVDAVDVANKFQQHIQVSRGNLRLT